MRQNKGKHGGKYVASVLNNSWAIYGTATGFRVSSIQATLGKANYTFAIKDGKFDRGTNHDAGKLREERPELYEAIEAYFSAPNTQPIADVSDEYGDIAWSQRKPFTPMQNWKRALLSMRKHALEAASKGESHLCSWDMPIRLTYHALFNFKIDQSTYDQAHDYITNHGEVDLQALLAVLRDYYDGKYRPNSCATLNLQFNLIAGNQTDEAFT